MSESTSMEIDPTGALYIKLGEGGKWEKECIEEQQTLRIGFEEVPHELCVEGKWAEVAARLRARPRSARVANLLANQIRLFYEAGEDVLWMTFYAAKLWWCFSEPRVTVLPDGCKTRPVVDRWSPCDVQRRELDTTRLSGRLVMLQRFQGTICSVMGERLEYLKRKINSEVEPEVEAAKLARSSLEEAVKVIVGKLHWRDFEILIDLILREAGWRRISELGGSQTPFDLELRAPITGKRYGVQIKSQADFAAFQDYERQAESMEGFDGFYFAVHSPSADLERAETAGKVDLLRPAEVAEWSVRYGLVDWIVDKAG